MSTKITRNTFKTKDALVTILGSATAAEESEFLWIEAGIRLDAGVGIEKHASHTFITHPHDDHCKNMFSLILNKPKKKELIFHVPLYTKWLFYEELNSRLRRNAANSRASINGQCVIKEVEANVPFHIRSNNKELIVVPFHTDHQNIMICSKNGRRGKTEKKPCSVGYAFIELRKRRKKQYENLSQEEIKKFKMENRDVQISEKVPLPQMIYTGDTTNNIFTKSFPRLNIEKSPQHTKKLLNEVYHGNMQKLYEIDWKDFPFILTECTFIPHIDGPYDTIIKLAKKDKHNHLGCLEKVAEENTESTYILCHFSARYTEKILHKFFLKKKYKNIVPWIST